MLPAHCMELTKLATVVIGVLIRTEKCSTGCIVFMTPIDRTSLEPVTL